MDKNLKLSDGTALTNYLAVAVAEGFCEGEDYQNKEDVLTAYSYIGIYGLHRSLQGFFGRNLYALVDNGYLDDKFNILEL